MNPQGAILTHENKNIENDSEQVFGVSKVEINNGRCQKDVNIMVNHSLFELMI